MRVLRIKAVENLLERLEDKIMENSETDKEGKKAKIEASVFSPSNYYLRIFVKSTYKEIYFFKTSA